MTSAQPPGIPPTLPPDSPLVNRDDEHLNLLSILHYVLGGITALFSCFPIIHVGLGVMMLLVPAKSGGGNAPPQAIGWVFIVVGGAIILQISVLFLPVASAWVPTGVRAVPP